MTTYSDQFKPFAEKMQAENLPDIVIKTFEHYYNQLVEGGTGYIPEAEIEPVESLPDAEELPAELAGAGYAALPKTVFLKLNGGLGTSMGLDRAKSLLVVKGGLSFLDIIARHAQAANTRLLLMNSFVTRDDTLEALEKYPALHSEDMPLDFVQHKVPKIARDDLSPVQWPQEPEQEWCPPGHGDIYTALVTSGMLDKLLDAGYEYAFVSNADNLGAVISMTILGYFVDTNAPFMMEVADRTPADSKGGHLAQRPDGQLILREVAQCPPEDMDTFQDISKHTYFNTNNLWINLPALKQKLNETDGILGLPMIRNAKKVDPRDPDSTPVYQLETAMGAAIAVFEGAQAIRIPRTRFLPVKKTNDLLALRSDAYVLADDLMGVIPNPGRVASPITIDLDSDYYKLIDEMEARFPFGAPSLIDCESLTIKGDVQFGRDIRVVGTVEIINETGQPQQIDDGLTIDSDLRLWQDQQ